MVILSLEVHCVVILSFEVHCVVILSFEVHYGHPFDGIFIQILVMGYELISFPFFSKI